MLGKAVLDRASLQEALDSIPKISMAHLPTPLEECPRLSAELGGPRILIKRDDCTGLAFGGNKARHFEYLMAEVKDKGYDAYINVMEWHSNNARMSAAACNRVGVRYILVLRGGSGKPYQGNMLVDHVLGAEIHLLETTDSNEADNYARQLGETLRAEGWNPYVVPDQPFPRFCGVVAFVQAALEVSDQLEGLGLEKVHIFGVAGRSTAGLALAAKNLGLPWKVTGVTVTYEFTMDEYVFNPNSMGKAVELLGLPVRLAPQDMNILTQYVGKAYGTPTPECIEAIKLVARTESIILEPNYTGKAMAALIDQLRLGNVGKDETVVFLHTGGLPGLFLYDEELTRER